MNNRLVLLIFVIVLIVLIFCFNCIKERFINAHKNINKIYVINLKKNPDRLNVFMKQAKEANIKVDRFDAINGKELSKNHPDIHKYFIENHGLNSGQIGCALSHIKIWEDAIKNNYKNIFVFEDDAIIPIDFWEQLNKCYRELPYNWDMLLLGGTNLGGTIYSENLLIPDKRSGNWGTFAMLLNINFIKKIMKEINLNTTIDDYLINNYYYNNNYKIFFVKKTIIEVDFSFNSDIGIIASGKNNQIVIHNNCIKERFTNDKELSKVKNIERQHNWNKLKFNEKLKIYGKNLNKNHAIFADKLRVKEIIKKFNISDLYYSKLIKVLDKNNNNLNLKELPKTCVIKTNNGWNDIIIIKNGKIDVMMARGSKMKPVVENYEIWKNKALSTFKHEMEQQYQYIKPEVFVEEFLDDSLTDYKFYCIHGVVQFILLMQGRFNNTCKIYFDKNLNKLNITTGGIKCKEYNFGPNEKKLIRRMVEMSEIISSLFEFSRIDFYLINNKIYFGEITFTPMGCNINLTPDSFNKQLGLEWI